MGLAAESDLVEASTQRAHCAVLDGQTVCVGQAGTAERS